MTITLPHAITSERSSINEDDRAGALKRRGLYWSALLAGLISGFLITGQAQSAQALHEAGAELARLLRAMAVIKAMIALAAGAAAHWRLGSPATGAWLAAYLAAGLSMAVGPGLIWDLRHVGLGALLLHAGLILTVVMLWRDPVAAARLETLIATRRARVRSRRAS